MIVTFITGGLGNQLFQYAMARRLAIVHKTELVVDARSYDEIGEGRPEALTAFARPLSLMKFRVKARIGLPHETQRFRDDYLLRSPRARVVRAVRRCMPNLLWKKTHIQERHYLYDPTMRNLPDDVYLQGFWQSEKYFSDVAPLIRQEVQLQDTLLSLTARQQIERLRRVYGQVVALHIRRGDLAHAHEVLKRDDLTYGAPASREYIQEALSLFDSSVCFYVFSDTARDIEWCRENLQGKDFIFSDAKSDVFDFMLMRYCDHNIISNSTFSWWAAWLNDSPGRRVVAPKVWSTYSDSPMRTDDLIPRDWTVL